MKIRLGKSLRTIGPSIASAQRSRQMPAEDEVIFLNLCTPRPGPEQIARAREEAVQVGLALQNLPVTFCLDRAGLSPNDVRVEAVVGRIDSYGALGDTEIVTLRPLEQRGSAWSFGCDYAPTQTGRLGCAFRISSNHFDHPLTRPCNALLKWA